ncbi:hypothetical protein GTHT12_03775 (plasmid) [Geobacillus thermodenitrificans]|uniref:hypothetical protein n=1 Tax=Geobacillus thermodenitrificans TaxID=33940 RepID=UPI000A2917B1|nr:hypothetical protein [Geobacillus thermodenitrificans]ARP44641.1 hypothetical protein GTHT12_03775 [Geobacillus thermodenitrificans]
MHELLHSFKVMALLLGRRVLFWIILAGFISYTYLGFHYFSSGNDFSPGEGLVRMSFSLQAGILIFLFLGVLFVRIEEKSHLEEVFRTIPHATRNKFFGKLLFFLLIIVFMTMIIWGIHYYLFSERGITTPSFYVHTFQYLLLYWSLTFFVSLLIGILVASWMKGKLVYPIILFIWILIGPVNTYFLGNVAANPSIGDFLVWINLGEPNPTALFNDLYGFELSSYHWIKKFMILTILSALLYITFYCKKAFFKINKIFIIITSTFLLLTIVFGIQLSLERQIYISNPYSSKSRDNIEYEYYYENYSSPPKSNSVSKKYSISQYDINLDIDRYVKVKVKLTIQNDSTSPIKTLNFTLYHGFKVNQVIAKKDHLSFKQKQDLLTITLKDSIKPNGKVDIEMKYSGFSSPLFFANERAVFLPYYFPWLPSANTRPAFAIIKEYGLLRENHQWNNPVHVTLNFSGSNKIYTNLTKTGEGKWNGTVSNGVSIIAGELGESGDGDTSLIEPTTWLVNSNEFSDFKNKIQNIFNYTRETYSIDELEIPKKIFYIPTLSISDSSNEDLVWYAKDHLIYGSYLMYNEKLIPNNESFLAYDIFPAITWKYIDSYTDNREYVKLFSDISAYLYNQKHHIEDDGSLIANKPTSDELQRKTKTEILKWIKSKNDLDRKIKFTVDWFNLIKKGDHDWQRLNELVHKYIKD